MKLCPAIVSVPVRGPAVLAAAVYETLPLPVPLAVTLSQLAFELAVHGQLELLMVRATELELPAEGALALELASEAVQPEA